MKFLTALLAVAAMSLGLAPIDAEAARPPRLRPRPQRRARHPPPRAARPPRHPSARGWARSPVWPLVWVWPRWPRILASVKSWLR